MEYNPFTQEYNRLRNSIERKKGDKRKLVNEIRWFDSTDIGNLSYSLEEKKKSRRGVSDLSEERIKIIIEFINDNYDTDLNRENLANAVDMNPDHLSRVFNQYTGKKIIEYVNTIRIEKAKKKLINSPYSIIDIAFSVGFDSLRTFYRYFVNETGITPSEYRANSKAK